MVLPLLVATDDRDGERVVGGGVGVWVRMELDREGGRVEVCCGYDEAEGEDNG